MPLLHAMNDAINSAYRWARANKLLFWSSVYGAVFFVPVIWKGLVLLSITAPNTIWLQLFGGLFGR